MQNPIIVALDVPTAARALELAAELAPVVGAFKIGKELFTSAGPEIVRQIRACGGRVFLDLKYHDIPNTVAAAVRAAVRLDIQMLTIHASGGIAMMQAAEAAAQDEARAQRCEPPLILAVTVLTSLDDAAVAEIGFRLGAAAQVEHLAVLAAGAGLRGLVCSPQEIKALRRVLPGHVQLVTPGIRPAGSDKGDQKRTLTPREALAAGANWLVIGRPICGAEKPRAAAEAILASLTA
jgi:orotidine-5'-phosphate decarboxylase